MAKVPERSGFMASQKKAKKRVARLKRQAHRRGTPEAAKKGWAKKQAARRFARKGARRARRGAGRSKNYKI